MERLEPGTYRLTRTSGRRNKGLLDLLRACPVKGEFRPVGDDRGSGAPEAWKIYLVDANVLSEATRASPDPKAMAWLYATG